MFTRWVHVITCIAAAASALAMASGGNLNDESLPLATVARTPKPAIDGAVSEGEWAEAAAVVGLRALGKKALPAHPAVAWITYDETNIYVGVRCPLPKGAAPKAVAAEHDGSVWLDDAVEVFIGPESQPKTYYQFIGNSAGTTWESEKQDGAWDCEWTYRSSVADDHWDAEMAIPFASLGGPPKDGDVWGFNVAHDCKTPTAEISSWAPVKTTLHEPAAFGHIRFRERGPAIRLAQMSLEAAAGVARVAGAVASADGAVMLESALLRRTDEGLRKITGAPQPFGAGTSAFGFALPLPRAGGSVEPGEYALRFSARASDGTVLAQAATEFEIAPVLRLATRKYFLSGTLEADVSVNRLPGKKWPAKLDVETAIRRPGVEAPLLMAGGITTPEKSVVHVQFDISGLAAGKYQIAARLQDEQGKELAGVSEDFQKPGKPPWLGSREGISDEVLPPWTPLKVKGTSVSPWGRRYEFAALPFPAKVRTAGAEVLSAPVRLVAVVEGNAQTWSADTTKIERRTDADVELSTTAHSPKLMVSGSVRVEYDGMMRSDLKIEPRGEAVTLDSLLLEIPLKEEHAKYLYHFPGRWRSVYNAGALPEDGWTGPFRPFIWLGDEDRGFAWFCESQRNWQPADPSAVTEIVRTEEGVVLRLHVIDEPQRLTEPLDYTFGFEATPVKPMDETVWDYRICHAGSYGIEDRPYRPEAKLTYPAKGNINLDEGTLEMWVRVEFDPNVEIAPNVNRGIYNRNLFLLSLRGGDTVGFYWNIDDRGMRFYVKKSGAFPIIMGGRQEWKKGELHHLALTWGDKARIYVDGELQVERDYNGLLEGDLSRAILAFGGGACDFAIDEIRISDVARSPGGFSHESEPDEHTLLLDHLNEAFKPDGATQTRAAKGAFPGDDTGGTVSSGARFAPVKFGNGLELYGAPESGQTYLDRLAELGVRTICFHEHWTDIQNYTSTTHGEALHKLVKACHERGIRLLLYFGYEMSNIAPEWPLYSDECLVFPRAGGYHRQPEQRAYIVCYNSPWQDFMADGIARMIDEYDIDGVYLDGTANPWACRNVHHGCGYKKPDGSIGPTYGIFAAREMMRRIYTIVKTRKPNGLVNVHQSTCMTIPSVGWATSYWDGEQFGSIERGPFALDVLPLDAFRTEFMGRQWGVPAEFLCYERPYTYNQATSFTLLHDVLVRGSGLGPNLERESLLWRVMGDFGREQAEWLPYWSNGQYVTSSPDGVKVSIYSRGARGAMLVVSNLAESEVQAQVTLSPRKLGLRGKLKATDRITDEDVPIQRGKMAFPMKSLTYRVIEVK